MKKLFVIGLVLLSFGCIIRVQSYVKPDVNFSNIKKVAIVKLGPQIAVKSESSTKSEVKSEKSEFKGSASVVNDFSQIITDALSMALMQRGFDVIQKGQLKVNEQSDLTEAERKALASSGIDAIILGTIAKRDTWQEKFLFSAKMYDVRTGEVIWSAFSHEIDGDDLNKLPKAIAKTIPIQPRYLKQIETK